MTNNTITLFDYLNNEKNVKKISKEIDKKLNSVNFWKNDEIKYNEIINKINNEHLLIKMDYKTFDRIRYI